MTVLKFVFIHFIFDLSVMKKKLMMCFAAAALLAGGAFTTKAVVEKNRDP